MEKRLIYFNEDAHRYTDDFGNIYLSTTTFIGGYEPKEDWIEMARRCAGKGRYKDMTQTQVLKLWKKDTKDACDKGNVEHNYLETNVKNAIGYNLVSSRYNNERLYTLDSIDEDSNLGILDEEVLITSGFAAERPRIFNFIQALGKMGYKMYPELGVYSYEHLLSGLVDLPLINTQTRRFIIVDWKTNKHDLIPNGIEELKYCSGYFKKDDNGKATTNYIETKKYFDEPLSHLQCSSWNKYSLQLSQYAHFIELHDYKCEGLILFHIRDSKYDFFDKEVKDRPELIDTKRTDIHKMDFYKNEIVAMFNHRSKNLKRNTQTTLW